MVELEGVIPILITPYKDDGEFDEESYRNEVRYVIENNVDGIVCLGLESEAAWFSEAYKKKILEITLDETDGKIPVVAGAITGRTTASIKAAKEAEDMGADAILLTGPRATWLSSTYPAGTFLSTYNIVEHYRLVSEAVGIPIVCYNTLRIVPGLLRAPTLQKLAELDNVKYFMSGDEVYFDFLHYVEMVGAVGDRKCMCGTPAQIFKALVHGKTVALSSTFPSVLPNECVEMWDYFKKGTITAIDKARAIWTKKIMPFIYSIYMSSDDSIATLKEMLRQLGIFRSASPIPPLLPVDDHWKNEIKKLLEFRETSSER